MNEQTSFSFGIGLVVGVIASILVIVLVSVYAPLTPFKPTPVYVTIEKVIAQEDVEGEDYSSQITDGDYTWLKLEGDSVDVCPHFYTMPPWKCSQVENESTPFDDEWDAINAAERALHTAAKRLHDAKQALAHAELVADGVLDGEGECE